MPSQRKAGALLGYVNIVVKNLVNLVYTPMLLHFIGQAEYGVYQSTYAFVFSLTLLTFGFSEAYVRFYMQKNANGTEEDIRRLNGMYLLLYIGVSLVALLLGFLFAVNAGLIFSKGFTVDEIALSRTLISIMTVNIACTLFPRCSMRLSSPMSDSSSNSPGSCSPHSRHPYCRSYFLNWEWTLLP